MHVEISSLVTLTISERLTARQRSDKRKPKKKETTL